MPRARDEAEAVVRQQLTPELRDYVSLADEWDDLANAVLGRLGGVDTPPNRGVKALLLARATNDLRATVLLAEAGYPMQSWATASSVFEMAHDIGFIGASDERAKRWVDHSDIGKRHWPVYDAVVASFAQLGLDPKLVPGEYRQYSYLCLAKHGNPVIQASHNLVDDGEAIKLRLYPYASRKVAKQLRIGLALAMRAMSYAVWMVARLHVDDEVLLCQIANASHRTRDYLAKYGQLDDLDAMEAPEADQTE